LHAHFRLYKICTQLPRQLPLFTSVEKCAIGAARNRPASTAHLAIRNHDRNKGDRSHVHSRPRWLSSQTPKEPVRRTRVQVYNNTPTPLNLTSQPHNTHNTHNPPRHNVPNHAHHPVQTLRQSRCAGGNREVLRPRPIRPKGTSLSVCLCVYPASLSLSVCPPVRPIL
jgi:hypothetical protein